MPARTKVGRPLLRSNPTTIPEPPSINIFPNKPIATATSVSDRWGSDFALFSHGYLIVPNLFIQKYALLKPPLTSSEAMFVLQLMTFKFGEESPFPSYRTIARCMKVSDKMVRRYAQQLEAKGYLKRVRREFTTNKFDLSGLFFALNQIARNKRQNAVTQKSEGRSIK